MSSLTIDLKVIIDQLNRKRTTAGTIEEAACVKMMSDFLLHRVQWRAVERANGENYQDRLEWFEKNSPFEDIKQLAVSYLVKHRIRVIENPAPPDTPEAARA